MTSPPTPRSPLPTQAQIIRAINDAAGETGVVVCAAGSAPGDLHKLWRARDPAGKGYHVEYGYSCMGYEIPGGIGVKLAAPEREVFVMVGDGSYLMLPGELVTAVAQRRADRDRARRQPRLRVDRRAVAVGRVLGFGTLYRFADNGSVPLDPVRPRSLPIDLAANAESLGARVMRARTIGELRDALAGARGRRRAGGRLRRDRSIRGGAELRELVGRAGGGGVRGGRPSVRRARPTSASHEAQRLLYAHERTGSFIAASAPGPDGTILSVDPRVGRVRLRRLRGARARRAVASAERECGSREVCVVVDLGRRPHRLRARRVVRRRRPRRSVGGPARRRLPAAGVARRAARRRGRGRGRAVLGAGADGAPRRACSSARGSRSRPAGTAPTSASSARS